jgi:hypothetical protein
MKKRPRIEIFEKKASNFLFFSASSLLLPVYSRLRSARSRCKRIPCFPLRCWVLNDAEWLKADKLLLAGESG